MPHNPSPLTPHPSPQSVGLLGGTFDPIHLGHLRMAEELAEALGLTEVRFLPTGTPPHRNPPLASAQHRLAMTRLAIAGNPRFVLDAHEIDKTAPCYMVDTLELLRAELGRERPLVLFLGADAFQGLTSWHAWQRLFDLAHLAVAQRPGFAPDRWQAALPAGLAQALARRRVENPTDLHSTPAGRIYLAATTQLDIAASRIRELVASGRSIRYLVADAVLDYIERHALYRT
jgi:nicotinate-nucleotide adenylyltransferase